MRYGSFRRVLAAVVVLSSSFAGCGSGDGPEEGRVADLELSGGCADAFFWAATVDGDLAVTVTVQAHSRSENESTVVDFTLPDPHVAVEVQRGRELTQRFCNDVIDANRYRLDSRQPGVTGSGQIRLDPRRSDGAACRGTAGVLSMEGLVADDGTRFDPIRIESDRIGCYAG